MLYFSRAAQCFASAEETLAAWNEIGRSDAVEAALLECSEGLSDIPRNKLSDPAVDWVSELDSFLDFSGLDVPDNQGGIATKAATLAPEDVGRISFLVTNLRSWFSAEARKAL